MCSLGGEQDLVGVMAVPNKQAREHGAVKKGLITNTDKEFNRNKKGKVI